MELNKNPPDGVSIGLGDDDNIFEWEVLMIGPADTFYEEGFFKAKLVFPQAALGSPASTAGIRLVTVLLQATMTVPAVTVIYLGPLLH